MNNHHKIFTLHGSTPIDYKGTDFFGQIYGERVILHGRTNHSIYVKRGWGVF